MKKERRRKIIVGVSGGIAAYKSAELVRLLKKAGYKVRVIMTPAATRFVTPLTFQALSGKPVLTDLWQPEQGDGMDHIRLAEKADCMIIAPATADLIGRIACGLGDDLLTTTLLAFKGPVFLAPAMNVQMFENPVVQRNLQVIEQLGHRLVGPDAGEMACGHIGPGRMVEPQEIFEQVRSTFNRPKDLKGYRVLVTAGPTQEALDSVRFLTNRSTGKMGYALAQAAQDRGARTTLVSGPTSLTPPKGVTCINVQTAEEMRRAVRKKSNWDFILMAAAVSDFSFGQKQDGKLKKTRLGKSLALVKNPDILAELGQARRNGNSRGKKKPILVGFSMETEDLIRRSKKKLKEKNVDLIVANPIEQPDAGFAVDTNRATLIDRQGKTEPMPLLPKTILAHRILDRALALA